MHHRISISSKDVPASSLFYSIADYTSLNDFAGKAIYIGLEWLTPIAANDVNTDFKFDLDHPKGLMLVLTNITSHNQATSWNGSGSILAYRCSRATPVWDTTAFVVTHRTCKRPHYRLFRTATTCGHVVPWTLSSYPREP